MSLHEDGTTVLIPYRLTEALIKGPKNFKRLYFPLMGAWTFFVPVAFLTNAFGVTKNPLAVILLVLPFYFILPVSRNLTVGRPARELSRKINAETGCGPRFEKAICTVLKTAPWDYRTPSYELAVSVEEDMLYVHRTVDLAEDLSMVTIGEVYRNRKQ